MTLADWRRQVAGLTLAQAAKRAGLSQLQAASIEERPHQASVGALRNYLDAIGGTLRIEAKRGALSWELSL